MISPIEKIKLTKELATVRADIKSAGAGALASIKKIKLTTRLSQILLSLGAGKTKEVEATQAEPAAIQPVASEPVKKSIGKRQKDNNAAVEALRKVKAGEADANDPLIREALKGYSGSGGGLTSAQGTNGSPHEYYTPEPVAKAMWDMLGGLGFTGGKVLDPSAGMGVFARTKPDSVAVEQIELDQYSGEINGLLNDSDTVSTKVSSFEEIAANTDDETFDAVVTNVPFGDKAMRGAHWRKDKKYQNANLQEYFILRGLEKIKPGGFAAFIVPPSVVGGKGAKAVKLRNAISMASEFIGAYRMPNMVFDEAGADTITDIIILHKHGKDNQLKIDELAQQDAAKLTEANVMWADFVEGNYFKTDGKRFQIGETTVGKGKFGEVEKVAYTGTISSVAALLKPFPKASRINWELLDATETLPIIYSEGDIVFSGGATLQMVGGKLIPVDGGLTNDDLEASGILAKFTSPLDAINQKLTLDDAVRALENERNLGRINDVPRWIIAAERAALVQSSDKSEWFSAVMAGMAVQEFAQSGNKEAINYDELYPELSKVLARVQSYSNKRAGIGGELVSDALKSIAIARKKGAFTAWWRGDIAKDKNVVLTENQAYEKAKIESEDDTGYISADVLKSQFTDFDPLNDDTWCVSPDGKGVMSADDYYFGNYSEFLKRAEMELQEATDPAVKEKLLRQHAKAQERITIIDTSRMKFSLETAFISIEDKGEFVKQYISTEITLNEDAKGNKVFKYSGSAPGSYASVAEIRRIKTLRRFAIYLNSNKISTQSKSEDIEDDPQEEKALLNSIKDMVQSSTAQFDAWAKSNEDIVNGIKKRLNDPENLSFTEVPNFAPVDIPNWNEAWVPHGYQYAAVRRFSKRFSGILGFDVGLGKAQPLDSKILTPTGWKLMCDIAVGDMVIAVDGSQVPVTGVYPQGEKEIFEVGFSDGSKTKCCDEHLWETQTELDRKTERYSRSVGKKRVIKGTVKPLSEIRETLVYQTQKNHKIPMVAPVQFAAQDVPIDPYVLGALIGDGHFGAECVELTCADDEMSDAITKTISESGMEVSMKMKNGNGDRCKSFYITRDTMRVPNNQMVKAIDALGLKSKLSHEKFIPQSYLLNTPEVRLAMLQGLMDTDGYVCNVGVTVQFSSSSEQLAKDVQFLVQSLGGLATIKSKIPTYRDANGDKKNGMRHYTVHLRLPPSIMPFRLTRKVNRVKPKSKYIPVRYITSVHGVGVAQAQCISIDHPTHLYVTDDFIITHNTLSALASVQYAHGIGSKKKTMFVVPNSVLTNWKKETEKAYKDTSDCLFVGLRPNAKGVMKYDSSAVAEDLNMLRENRHAKVFVTYDVLTRIPLRDDTLDAYKDYLLSNDDSFSKAIEEGKKEKTRDKIAGESAVAAALESGDKAQGIPYFEDMGIDSLVLDEAHNGKNSKKFSSEFVQAKFVANPTVSQRGMDMQAKCWYVRGMTKNNDGIMALTATPVTNSPLEIYAMLTLAIGEKDMNAMCGCTGADSFMQNTCDIEDRDEDTITGAPRSQRTLKGIANLDILRRVLDASAMIETAESVAAKGIVIEVPESEESAAYIELPPEDTEELIRMKNVYELARAAKDGSPQSSAFNLIRKMNKLITDRELYEGKFKFAFASKDKAKAEAAAAAFNKLNITEERKEHELSGDIDVASLKSKVVTDKTTGNDVVIYYVPVKATIEKNKIVLPATDYDTHDKFMKQVDKAGLLISAEASPKIKAMLDNIKKENASPRWKPAKQIIFCDELALHHKLKLLISSETGIPGSKISIVNAKSVSPDQMQDVQDGFNANEDDNRYQIVIGNKKIEVGVNLQQGTQALHHLTIGWTPDSIHQRNGRGVRQGNRVETPIMIYHYEANGTFDAYKRRLVSVKGDWIDSLMDKDQEHVTIEGDLSKEDYERMVALVGDSAAMAQFNSDMSKKAKEQASNAAKIAQVNSLSVKAGREKWLESYELDGRGFTLWLKNKQAAITDIAKQISVLSERLSKTESALMADRCTKKIEELQVKQGAVNSIIEGVEIPPWSNINAADFPDTPAAINWNKDVAINKKMLAEAQSAFDARVTQGYGKSTAENLANGNAIIVNGKIVSNGDFAIVNGAPGIVTMQSKSWNAPASMSFVSLENGSLATNNLNGLTISKHGIVGSEARSEILQLLVELDEASIAKGIGTEGLFARFSSEVRGALRSVIPSLWESTTNSAWVAAPNFPLLMPQGLDGEFLQSIIAKQAEFVEYKTEGYREQFRFKNTKFQGDDRKQTAFEAISQWMIANNAAMSMDEVRNLSRHFGRMSNELYLQANEALPAIIEKASNITELDSALVAYVNATHPWISGLNDAETIISEFNLEVAMKKARVKLDDGSVKYDAVIPAGDFRQSGVSTDLANMIEAHFAGGVMNKELMEYANATGGTIKSSQIDTRGGAELLIAFDHELFNAVGGKLDNGLVDMSSSPMINEIRSKLNLGKGAIVKLDPEYITGVSHAADSAVRAYAAKQAQDALDIDVDGLVAAIQAHADINTAIVSMVDYVKLSDRFTGSFNYKAGTYLRLDMRYGSTLQKNISDKTIGLEGRVFDKNAKDWLISLSPANFSDGKPVADITAFAKFADIDSTQFKKG